ncbi:hypothetical protein ACX0G9_02675 [Flavitalea flava]
MAIIEVASGRKLTASISPLEDKDFKLITKKRHSFDWKKERGVADLFKLTLPGESEILGLLALIDFPREFRIQIQLLSVSRENLGRSKKYEGIAGCLIAFAGRIAVSKYFEQACISLLPKTELRSHYKSKYGMLDGGPQLFLEGARLQTIIKNYLP